LKNLRRSKANLNKKQVISDVSLIISNALAEDIQSGDITCRSVFKGNPDITAKIFSKQSNIVICGLNVLKEVFSQIDSKIKISFKVKEGSFLKSKRLICVLSGPAKSILKAERTALNFLGRLSGIATKTHKITQKIRKYKAKVLDTRKTTPGLRLLEKYAVSIGGGINHRFGLFDQVLIKDNHIQIIKNHSQFNSLCDMIKSVRSQVPLGTKIEIEVDNLEQFKDVIRANPDIVMLDNMNCKKMKQAVAIRNQANKNIKLEASGNISEKNIEKIAACGVDLISIGGLTHSIECVDYSLKLN
jgi:nicotinate-nucleotide pyrophosphorylase (carboxylating)